MPIREQEATKSIPEPIRLLQECLNTRFGTTRADEWGNSEQLRAWLLQRQLLTEEQSVTQSDYHRMLEVRAAMRGLLRMNNEGVIEPTHIDTLNHLAKRAPLHVSFQQDGQTILTSELDGVDGVISTLFIGVLTAMANGSWSRLKICHNERCQKVFYDVSKNRSGTWCMMAKCGSRAKARAYQERRRKQGEENGREKSLDLHR
jgi:predicted RNA-binding Zn ribbon-like protein